MDEYRATVIRVVDGDSIDLSINLGFGQFAGDADEPVNVRLHGVDTPEPRTRDRREKKFGLLASQRVRELLPRGAKVKIRAVRVARHGEALKKTRTKRGARGRALVSVLLPDGRDLGSLLVNEFLAVPYHGESKAEIRHLHEANWDWLEARERRA